MTTLRTRFLRFAAPMVLFFFALGAHAQAQTTGTAPNTTGIDRVGVVLLSFIYFIDRYLVPLIFAIAFIVFLIGIYRYFIAGAANEEKRKEGQQFLLWGLIGFFLMLSVWGIVNLLVGTFGFNTSTRPPLPTFGPAGSSGTSGTSGFVNSGTSGTVNTTNTGGVQTSPPATGTVAPGSPVSGYQYDNTVPY